MSRTPPECLDSDPSDRSVAAGVSLRREPDEEEDEDEDEGDGKRDDDDGDNNDDGTRNQRVVGCKLRHVRLVLVWG